MWTNPIFDRTQADVYNKTNKGYMNVSDLNRIEGNIEALSAILGFNVEAHEWSYADVPTVSQMQVILDNLAHIKELRPVLTEDVPEQPINTVDKLNSIEHILFLIYENILKSESARLYAGMAGDNYIGYAGQDIGII